MHLSTITSCSTAKLIKKSMVQALYCMLYIRVHYTTNSKYNKTAMLVYRQNTLTVRIKCLTLLSIIFRGISYRSSKINNNSLYFVQQLFAPHHLTITSSSEYEHSVRKVCAIYIYQLFHSHKYW